MKKVRLLFELCFIFVLPLIIIGLCISIDKDIDYTVNADGVVTAESSSLNLNINNLNWINTTSVNNIGYKYVYYSEEEFDDLDQSVFSNFRFNCNSFVSSEIKIGYYTYNSTVYYLNSIYYCSEYCAIKNTNYNYTNIFISSSDQSDFYWTCSRNNSSTYSITFLFIENFWIKEVIEVKDYKNSNPIYNLLVFLENQVGISTSSDVTKIINYYNCLWLLFWLIWHLLYGFADLFVHLFDKKDYDLNR